MPEQSIITFLGQSYQERRRLNNGFLDMVSSIDRCFPQCKRSFMARHVI